MIWDLNGTSDASKGKGKGKAAEGRPIPTLVKTIPVLERIEAIGMIVAAAEVASTSQSSTVGRLRFYTGGEKGVIRIWDATNAEVIASYGVDISERSEGSSEESREIMDVMYVYFLCVLHSLIPNSISTNPLLKLYTVDLEHIIATRRPKYLHLLSEKRTPNKTTYRVQRRSHRCPPPLLQSLITRRYTRSSHQLLPHPHIQHIHIRRAPPLSAHRHGSVPRRFIRRDNTR